LHFRSREQSISVNKGGTAGIALVLYRTGVFCLDTGMRNAGKKEEESHMKKTLTTALSALLAASMLAGCSSSTASSASGSSRKTIKVAVVKQLDHASLDQIADAITAELDKISKEKNVDIEYGDVYSGQNDQTTLKQICDQAVSDGVDVIIPIATLAAQTAAVSASDSGTPVVYAAISDPESAELTGLDNVTGTSDALDTEKIIDMMLAQNPNTKKVGLLYSKSEANSEAPIKDAKEYLEKKGIEYVEATGNTNDEVIAAASSLAADKVDAVFTPTDNVVMAAELAIADTFSDAGIPHYTGADSFVRNGAFATCGVNYTDLGTKTADLAYKAAAEGMDDMKDCYTMDGGIVTVNTDVASKLGIDDSVFKDFGDLVEVTTSKE
jgi:putative ABC transport system substrate-binding protein